MSLKQIVSLILSLCSFVFTFFVVWKLMLLLSTPAKVDRQWVWLANLLDNKSLIETAFPYLTLDLMYITMFIVQHSFMKSKIVKKSIAFFGLDLAERAIYSLATCYTLNYLVSNWNRIPTIALWQIDVSDSTTLWWTFVLIHILAWATIYGGSLMMDLPEILGMKQVYYDVKNLSPPMQYKVKEFQNLLNHVRHPSFIGFTLILWATNIMTLDRFALALMMTLYMYISWSTTDEDAAYQKHQLQRKRIELSYS